MSPRSSLHSQCDDDDDGTQRVLEEFLRRRRSGDSLNEATLVADHPDLGANLENSFRALEAIEQSGHATLGTVTWPPSSTNAKAPPSSPLEDSDSRRTLLGALERRARFDVQACLGAGAFGVVYLAHDTLLDRQVALKVPKKSRFPTPEHFAQFVAEARLAARLKHPHIIAVYDVCEERDVVFMVMEYVAGQSLRGVMQGKPLAPADAARLMEQMAEAVAYANQCGLVHRDLKPSNVLIDKDGTPHVADFGLAVHEEAQRLAERQSAGTPGYMAPEQVRGQNHLLDGRTDLWSLGVILYEMLTGRRPFLGADHEEVFYRIVHQEPKPLRQIRPEIPPELETICLRCLAKPMEQRYSTVADLASELRRWLTSSNGELGRPSPSTEIAWGWPAAAVGLLLMAVVGGLWAKLNTSRGAGESQPQPMAALAPSQREPLASSTVSRRDVPIDLQPGRWRSLLTQPPTPVVWPDDDFRSRVFPNLEEEHVHAVCVGDGLLSLGRVDRGAYEFKVDVLQARWEGGAGVFFGRHEAHDPQLGRTTVRYQRLDVRQVMRQGKRDSYAIVRRVVAEWKDDEGRLRTRPFELTSAEVAVHDLRPHQLQLSIQNNRLMQVRWAGQPLPDLVADPYGIVASQVRADDHHGTFGLLVSSCSADFYQAEALAHPAKGAP